MTTLNPIDAFLSRLKHPTVRDLFWACFSPSLLAEGCYRHQTHVWQRPLLVEDQRWLLQLDQHPAPLLTALSYPPCHLLGVYFERLWQFYLRHSPTCDLLAHNIQLHQGKTTLGELDFVYQCHIRQRVIHMEVAVKYYLATYTLRSLVAESDWSQWLGPACRDRLDLKLNKLLDQQCQLTQHALGQQCLQQLGVSSCDKELLIKGRLFYPYQMTPIPPKSHHQIHLRGNWLFASQFHKLFTQSSLQWARVDKPNWFAIDRHAGIALTQLPDISKPIYCVAFDAKQQCHHYMVVPDSWPDWILE